MTRRKGRTLAALSLVAGLSAVPRTASADRGFGSGEAIVFTLLGVLVVDAAFITYDTIVVANHDLPGRGACVAEAIVGVPQVLLYAAFVPQLKEEGDSWLASAVATMPMFMGVHGIWGVASRSTTPGALYGVSWGAAADLSFTMPALYRGTGGHLLNVGGGVAEMVATAPQIAVATPNAIDETGSERTAWYALDGWASLLFVHGAVSTVVSAAKDDPLPPSPPPPPPEPAPVPNGPLEMDPPSKAPRPTGHFIVPGTASIRPMALPGGMGVSFGAVLW